MRRGSGGLVPLGLPRARRACCERDANGPSSPLLPGLRHPLAPSRVVCRAVSGCPRELPRVPARGSGAPAEGEAARDERSGRSAASGGLAGAAPAMALGSDRRSGRRRSRGPLAPAAQPGRPANACGAPSGDRASGPTSRQDGWPSAAGATGVARGVLPLGHWGGARLSGDGAGWWIHADVSRLHRTGSTFFRAATTGEPT